MGDMQGRGASETRLAVPTVAAVMKCAAAVRAEKSKLVGSFAVRCERLRPQCLRFCVRTIDVAPCTAKPAGPTLVNDHRVVPRAQAVRQFERFASADGVRE